MAQEGEVKIKKVDRIGRGDLDFSDEEAITLGNRILKLRDDQVVALASLVKVIFRPENRDEVLADIRSGGWDSGHLSIIVYEADSKENLVWWIEFFEKYNAR